MSRVEKIVQSTGQLDPRRQPGWWEAKAKARAAKEYEKLKTKEQKRDEKALARTAAVENFITKESIEPIQVSEIAPVEKRLPNGQYAPGFGPGRKPGVKKQAPQEAV